MRENENILINNLLFCVSLDSFSLRWRRHNPTLCRQRASMSNLHSAPRPLSSEESSSSHTHFDLYSTLTISSLRTYDFAECLPSVLPSDAIVTRITCTIHLFSF